MVGKSALTHPLKPTCAVPVAFGCSRNHDASWLRWSLAPPRLGLREVVERTHLK
jgi:hypothetical protein